MTSTVTSTLAAQLPEAVAAFQSGSWKVGLGLAIAFVIGVLRFVKILDFVPDAYDKWVAAGMAAAGAGALGLQANQGPVEIISAAIVVGATAIAGWETTLRPARDKIFGRSRL